MFNPENLDLFVWTCRNRLKPFRERAQERLKAIAGSRYGDNTTTVKDRPINLSALYYRVLAHRLMSATPQCAIIAKAPAQDDSAEEQEAALNEWANQVKLGDTLSECVLEALLAGFGVCQTGLLAWGNQFDAGAVRCQPILIDDWVHDMMAERRSDVTVMGHKYRARLDLVQNDPSIDIAIRRGLKPSASNVHLDQGVTRQAEMSRGSNFWYTEIEPHIDLWQLYFPQYRLLQTYLASGSGASSVGGGSMILKDTPLRSTQWKGPAEGPYDILELLQLPGNTVGLSPIAQWELLDEAVNSAGRKVIYDIKRSKKIGVYLRSFTGDSKTIAETPHGEACGLEAPDSFRELPLGFPSEEHLTSMQALHGLANMMAGNLDQAAGLESQAPTATQENLLHGAADVAIQSLQAKVMAWTSNVFRHAGGWLWSPYSNPNMSINAFKKIPGSDEKMAFTMTKGRVEGQPDDYTYDVVPYSHVMRTPEERLQQIMQLTQGFLMPLLQPMSMQGIAPDFQYLVHQISRLSGSPEIARFLPVTGAPSGQVPQAESMLKDSVDGAQVAQ